MAVCKEAAMESVVEVRQMNMLEATRLLMLMWTKDEVNKSGLQRYLPVRRKIPGKKLRKLGLTTAN